MVTKAVLEHADAALKKPEAAGDRAMDALLDAFLPRVDASERGWQWLLGLVTIAILVFEAWALSTKDTEGDTYSELARQAANAHLWIYPLAGFFTGIFTMILLKATRLGFGIRLVLLGWTATFAHIFWWF
jgi:hypothetical protein